MTETIQLQCRDLECESRSDCPHSQPHEENEECRFFCDVDDPCTRCYPIGESHDQQR